MLGKILSKYAEDGVIEGSISETVAEAYSAKSFNKYAEELITLLEEMV